MPAFTYVYILQSTNSPKYHYTGLTQNLKQRLHNHNSGQVKSTTRYRPWQIEVAIAFGDQHKAAAFERYLKMHSGRAFASKHF